MKTAGMIGGLGPESTIAYYRTIIARYRARTGIDSYPQILINSLDVAKGLRLTGSGMRDELAAYLIAAVRQLAAAGADFAFISANTPHLVFEEVSSAVPIPLLSIVEAACAHAKAQDFRRLGIFGTRFTMQAPFYRAACDRAGITLLLPNEEQQAFIHDTYVGELVNGTFRAETREALERIIDEMHARLQIDGLLLAGTELPLLLTEPHGSVPLLDTTAIHVERIVDEILS